VNQDRAPVLDALADYHRLDRYGFTPPGHRQGRGIDARVRKIMGSEPFRDEAAAVGAKHAFFSTCGSSLSHICHERGKPLIVDEAWGAHLPFNDQLPAWAMDDRC
jgi:arginine/lysine/ornithine decarboxylase